MICRVDRCHVHVTVLLISHAESPLECSIQPLGEPCRQPWCGGCSLLPTFAFISKCLHGVFKVSASVRKLPSRCLQGAFKCLQVSANLHPKSQRMRWIISPTIAKISLIKYVPGTENSKFQPAHGYNGIKFPTYIGWHQIPVLCSCSGFVRRANRAAYSGLKLGVNRTENRAGRFLRSSKKYIER